VSSGRSFCSDETHLSKVKAVGATDLYSLKKSALKEWTLFTRRASLATSTRFTPEASNDLGDPNVSFEQLRVHPYTHTPSWITAPPHSDVCGGAATAQVHRTIGTGQNGRVKLVEHMTTGECFAMKCLNKQAIMKAGSEETVKSEIKAMRLLDSPFVVKLVGTMRDPAQVYLLMELVPGGELFKVREVAAPDLHILPPDLNRHPPRPYNDFHAEKAMG